MSIGHHVLANAAQSLLHAGIDNAVQEAKWLWEHVTGRHWSENFTPSAEILSTYETLLARRRTREPLSQILGHQPFWSLDFYVNMHTLTPRSDSETVVEAALAQLPETQKPYRLLDLGTGTGCLLLTLLHERPPATGIGIDQSNEALAVAARNANKHNLSARADFRLGDWTKGITESFDLILSNPPYIPETQKATLMPEVRDFEPHQALFGGEDGLDDYRRITAEAPALLKSGGSLVLELGIGQEVAVKELAIAAGLKWKETRRDLNGIERAMILTKDSHAATQQQQ